MKKALLTFLITTSIAIFAVGQEVQKAKMQSEDPVLVSLQNKIRTQQNTIDSLILLIVQMEEEGSIVQDIDEDPNLEDDVVKLGKLALQLDQALFDVLNGDAEMASIRKYFLPRFSANFVSVNKEGVGQIAIVTHENFGEHLANYTDEQTSFKIVNIDFLDTEIAGNVFNLGYKTIVEVYVDGKLFAMQSILTTLTGRRDKYNWKVGNYSSTSIEFEPEKK
jgi:hypothetical protein